ncbi:MAG: DUF4959 domain-containing protein, partial [Treponema sp.]|nr:DUF4959 domain-containing protein [Treponema sp.]
MKSIIGKVIFVFTAAVFIFAGCKNEVENIVDNIPPAEVTNLWASSGDSTVSLYWENPDDSDFYATRITFVPAVSWVTQPVVIEGNQSDYSSAVFNGLENGTEYTFRLITMDKNQNKSNGVTYKAIPIKPKDITPPAEIENLNVKAGDKSAVLSWTNPSDDDFYKVQITFTPEVQEIIQPIVIKGEKNKASSTTISGLENNTEYKFWLITLDNTLNKSQGVCAKVTPVDLTPPVQINNVTAVSRDKSVILSWINPNDIDFDFVEISFTPENAKITQPVVVHSSSEKNASYTISELENDTEYTFTLFAVDKSLNKSTGVSIKS